MIAISPLFLDVAHRRCINSKNRLLSKEADLSLDIVSRESRVIFFLDEVVNSFILETALSYRQLLIREFDVQDPLDPRFWIEVDMFYMPETNRTELYLRGSNLPVLVVKDKFIVGVNEEPVGVIRSEIVPTTLDILYEFIPIYYNREKRISKFCATLESYHDFIMLVFLSVKNLEPF